MDAAAANSASVSVRSPRLALLGPFELRNQCRSARRLPKKAQALLAHLALHSGQPIPREQLATLLWGDTGTDQARQSLRQCLMSVRAALGPGLIVDIDGAHLALSRNVDVDVRHFETLARSTRLGDLETAKSLYRNEFLAGLHIASEAFGEWVAVERRRFAAMMSDVLLRLATRHVGAGDIEAAMEAARRLTVFDPLCERGHRLSMQALAAAGRRGEALKQYARCVDILRRELGVMPESATVQLAESIRTAADAGQTTASAAAVKTSRAIKARRRPRVTARNAALNPANKASIVVLPFTNLSDDPGQAYLVDGIAEDMTNALGRLPWLSVMGARGATDVRQIGRYAGYVLRGSVRRAGSRLRIVVQLLDAPGGGQIWSDRFEGDCKDVFDTQDRVAAQVAALIAPTLHAAEIERAQRQPTRNLTAYELYLKAVPKFRRSAAENEQALQLLRQAVALDPLYGAAFALAARCYHFQKVLGWVHPADPRLQEGVRLARIAGEVGRNDSEALWMAGLALVFLAGELEHGAALIAKSLSFNPNSANAWVSSCFAQSFLGDVETAIDHFGRAQRLNPLDTMHHVRWNALANAYFIAGRYEAAAQATEKTLSELPSYPSGLRMKVAICGLLGRVEDGEDSVRRLLAVNPDASVSSLRVFWQPLLRRNPNALDNYLEGLRRAGLPV